MKGKILPKYLLEAWGVYAISFDSGALLAGMPMPQNNRVWNELYAREIESVICLTHDEVPYLPSPVKVLKACELIDQYDNSSCDINKSKTEMKEERDKIRTVVDIAFHEVSQGRSLVVHCLGGTGRTGTILAGLLRESGHSWKETKNMMNEINIIRGRSPGGWPESTWQQDLIKDWR